MATPAQTITGVLDRLEQLFKNAWDKNATAPTIAAHANLGTSPTVAVASESNDGRGKVTLTSGTGTPAAGEQATVTFATAWKDDAPFVFIVPANAAARDVGAVGVFTVTNASFKIGFKTAAAVSTAHDFFYFCVG